MPLANDVLNQIFPNQYALTSGNPVLISQARRGRAIYAQAATGTVMLGSLTSISSGIGISITGSQVFDDYSSATWYAVAIGGNATLNVLELYDGPNP